MSPERWQELKSIFFAAADQLPEQRETYLEEACAGDPELRSEVERLLSAESGPHSLLDATPEQLMQLVEEDEADSVSRVGETVGPYRILRPLGEGGMGTVYLAEREDLGQQVALKVVRGSRTDAESIRRLMAERRILAQLEHPHIARLLDAGVTEDGVPFFTMEHVPQGTALTTYCSERQLGVEQRLALFLEACEAVWYAHRCLVIHRDLKPSNILVTEDETGRATVKLVDFGIAKRLAGEGETPGFTQSGMLAMTPSYASPEQVRGEVMTTATDVYTLGLILYELLVGRRPYDVEGLRASQIEQRICETEPARPSTALRRGGARGEPPPEGLPWVPADPGRLRGDLDSICLRALEKEPHCRYPSVDALRSDLQRHLAGRPVEARPRGVVYRLGKFVRRHRLAVGAAVLVGMALVSLVLFYTWRLASERDRVVRSLAESEAVTAFLIELFEANDPDAPNETKAESITVPLLLERGLQRADALNDQPLVQARMLDAIGSIQFELGDFAAARPSLERAFALRLEHLGWSETLTAESAHNLGIVLNHLALHEEAEALLREALDGLSSEGGEMTVTEAALHNELGTVMAAHGQPDEAVRLYRLALEANRQLLGPDDPEVATNLGNIALVLYRQGRLEEAEELYREALSIRRRLHGETHTKVALLLNNLGLVLFDRGDRDGDKADYQAAAQMLQDSLTIRRGLLGSDHPSIATSLNNLGILFVRLQRPEDAVSAQREALAIRRLRLGEEHPLVALSLNNLGNALMHWERYEEAATQLKASMQLRGKLYGQDHPSTASPRINLARVFLKSGDFDQAESEFLVAQTTLQGQVSPEDLRLQRIQEGLSALADARAEAADIAPSTP